MQMKFSSALEYMQGQGGHLLVVEGYDPRFWYGKDI
jgi:hypothetical protein